MFGSIAKKFNVSVKALETANPGVDSSRLKIGTTIHVPAAGAASTPTASTKSSTKTTVAAKPASSGTSVASSTVKAGATYKVKKGDTLSTIARAAYGAAGSWQKIFKANPSLPDPNSVAIGTELKIPE